MPRDLERDETDLSSDPNFFNMPPPMSRIAALRYQGYDVEDREA